MASYFLTKELADRAIEQTGLVFNKMLDTPYEKGGLKRHDGAAVVVDPTILPIPGQSQEEAVKRFLTQAVITLKRWGVENFWEYPYDQIALGKAFLTWLHRLPSVLIQTSFAYLLQDGDTLFGGSVIDEGGLIAAFSGVDSEHDVMIAGIILDQCKGIAQRAANQYRHEHPEDNFIKGASIFETSQLSLSYIDLGEYQGREDMACPYCHSRLLSQITKGPNAGEVVCNRCHRHGDQKWFHLMNFQESTIRDV